MACQIEFFPTEKSEIECLRSDIQTVKESNDKVRKGIFARHGELARKYIELNERMQILERNICLGTATTTMTLRS
jgi:hypothetical protein